MKRLAAFLESLDLESPLWAAIPVLLAGFLCFYHLGFQSVWYDEAVTFLDVSAPFRQLPMVVDAHPPLYFAITRLSFLALGKSEAALRLPSAVFGTLTIILAYGMIRQMLGGRAAFWTSLLWAVLPFHVYYAHEARMYSLLPLEAVLSLQLWERALERDGLREWAAFVSVSVTGLYTHYWFAFFVLSEGLGFFVVALRRRERIVRGAVAFVLAGFAFIPCFTLLSNQVYRAQIEQNRLPFFTHARLVAKAFSGTYVGQPIRILVKPWVVRGAFAAWSSLLILGYAAWPDKKRITRLVLVGFLLPMSFAWIAAQTLRPDYNSRYFALLLPVVFFVIAGAFAHPSHAVRTTALFLATTVVCAGLLTLVPILCQPVKGPWRVLNRCVKAHGGETPSTALEWVDVPRYIRPPTTFYFAQKPVIGNLSQLPRTANQVVIVGSRNGADEESRRLPAGWRMVSRCEYAGGVAIIGSRYPAGD